MFIVHHRKIFYIFSGTLVAASIIALFLWGLNFGIDFKGGSLLELEFKQKRPPNQEIRDILNNPPAGRQGLNLGETVIQASGENGMILRMKDIDENTHQSILAEIKKKFDVEELRFESVGPLIGRELKRKAIYSIVLAEIFMVIYLAWAFRKTSFVVKSYRYGVLAAVSLFHDILIVIGVFSVMGHFYNVEVGISFVAALLTVLGYSINDTIVVYDRIRENLLRLKERENFDELVDRSIKQTIARSINTSLTTLLVLFTIFIFGGATIKYFILALIIGIASGTYSSFLASFLLTDWELKSK